MPNTKSRLDPDQVHVESFATHAVLAHATAHAGSISVGTPCELTKHGCSWMICD